MMMKPGEIYKEKTQGSMRFSHFMVISVDTDKFPGRSDGPSDVTFLIIGHYVPKSQWFDFSFGKIFTFGSVFLLRNFRKLEDK